MEISEKFRVTSNLDVTYQVPNGSSLIEYELNSDTFYFCIHDKIPSIVSKSQNSQSSKPVGIFWDCSLSQKSVDRTVEYNLITKVLGTFLPGVVIEIVCFSNNVVSTERFVIEKTSK
jgi:hypothetical protein